jgi:hypothetical protein
MLLRGSVNLDKSGIRGGLNMRRLQLGSTIVGLSLLFLAGQSTTLQAAPKRLIASDLNQGQRTQSFWLNQTLVQTFRLGGETRRIYSVDVEVVATAADSDRIKSTRRQTNLVQCSTAAPFIAFKSPFEKDVAILDYLNPGGDVFGYNQGSHWLYWAVCQNLWVAQSLTDYDLAAKAKSLGYSPDLKVEQVEIPYMLMRSLK